MSSQEDRVRNVRRFQRADTAKAVALREHCKDTPKARADAAAAKKRKQRKNNVLADVISSVSIEEPLDIRTVVGDKICTKWCPRLFSRARKSVSV